jgi:hypothetical protein
MSDHFLRIFPAQVGFVPDELARKRAEGLLRDLLPTADHVLCVVHEQIEFVDPGSNFEAVACPKCGADLFGPWQDWMDSAAKSAFSELALVTPCCGLPSSPSELAYKSPAGFARVVLEARNASISGALAAGQVAAIEGALGCPVRQVLAHY